MSKARDSVRAQVRAGLLLTAGLLGSFAWLVFALYGVETLRGRLGRLLHPAVPAGLAILAVLLTFAWLTVQHWGKFFPGFLAYGAINAIGVAATGHTLGPNPAPVARLDGWLMVAFLAGAALATVRFARRGPTRAGALAMTGYLACFLWLIADPRESAAAFGAGFALLAAAWVYDRLSGEGGTRRGPRQRPGRTPAAQASSRGHVERGAHER